jgi:hypothetical protein
MAIVSTHMVKMKPSLPYMTAGEASLFKQLRTAGSITFFRTAECKGVACTSEVPQGKSYCSKECYEGDEHGASNDEK